MATKMLVLGNNCDYYGVKATPECVAEAVRKVYTGPQQFSHGVAFLQNVADYGKVIPYNRLCPYGASFPQCIAANPSTTLSEQILRLIDKLLAEGNNHQVDYVLIHSLEITEEPHNGCGLLAWAQMLNTSAGLPIPSVRSPEDHTRLRADRKGGLNAD